jgi:formylglycine-generating enzyme required for sulfatase activity
MEMLNTIALRVVQRVPRYVADQQRDVVDAQLESGLIQDLQTLKLIAQALRRQNAREGSGSADEPLPGLRNEATGMEFVRIPPGEFMMGCSLGNRNCDGDEKPAHLVRLTKGFEMGIYEVTQAQWESVMGSNPSHFRGANLPVEQVSWNDAQEFLQKLNTLGDGYQYRLPTEAEWEYAARAGTMTLVPGSLDAVAWYSQNSGSQTHPVGQKQPNPWGLYDMIGNVWEWVQDWYDPDYYQSAPATDPAGPSSGQNRSLRGGSWYYVARDGRISYRDYIDPAGGFDAMGFRCVRAAIPAN